MSKFDVTKLSKYLEISEYEPNSIIHHEGDNCNHVCVIIEGEVEIASHSYEGSKLHIAHLTKGDIIGDILLFSNIDYYMGDVITLTNSKIGKISHSDILYLLQEDKTLLDKFLRNISERAMNMNMRLKLLSQKSLRDKIIFYLKEQKRLLNSNTIPLLTTKEQLSNYLNVERPSLSRELSKMKRENLIDCDRTKIIIKDLNV